MSYRLLELSGMVVSAIDFEHDRCTLKFKQASVIKVMDAAKQRTRWQQSGRIIVQSDLNTVADDLMQALPCRAHGGEFQDNVLTYRDTIRLPCHVYGDVGVVLYFKELKEPLRINGKEMEVVLASDLKYLHHLD